MISTIVLRGMVQTARYKYAQLQLATWGSEVSAWSYNQRMRSKRSC